MANSIRARLVGVALGALAVACSSYAAPISNDAKLHLAAAPEDFKALGIGKEIEVREDGRRTPQSSDYFEWWYFDGLFDDGTVFVVWFGDNWLYGSSVITLGLMAFAARRSSVWQPGAVPILKGTPFDRVAQAAPVLFGASPRQAKQYRQSIQVRTY